MSPVIRALLDELRGNPIALRELAEALAPLLTAPDEKPLDGWLTTRQAADHLGVTLNALHKLTAARAIPFEQDGPGCKCWFRRSDLDAWRAGQR